MKPEIFAMMVYFRPITQKKEWRLINAKKMIREKDFLMRMLFLFLEKLAELLSKKSISEISDADLTFFYDQIPDTHQNTVETSYKTDATVSAEKCRMLAELLYIETLRNKDGKQVDFANKSLEMFDLYNQKTKTYDFGIIEKTNYLRELCSRQNELIE